MAKLFVEKILIADIDKTCMELHALKYFSKPAAAVVHDFYRKLIVVERMREGKQVFHGRPLRFISNGDVSKISPQFDKNHFATVSDHAMTLFSIVIPPLESYLDFLIREFDSMACNPIEPASIQQALASVGNPFAVNVAEYSPVNYLRKEGTIKINTTRFSGSLAGVPEEQLEHFWNTMLFTYLPKMFENSNLNGMKVINEIVGMRMDQEKEAALELLSKRAEAMAKREADLKRREEAVEAQVQQAQQAQAEVEINEEGWEVYNIVPQDSEAEEAAPSRSSKKAKVSPPDGYMPYEGPQLFIKKN